MVEDASGDDDFARSTGAHRPLTAALELVRAGYFVAPVIIRRDPKTGKKIGDYLGVKWHDQATCDPDQVRAWYADHGPGTSFLVDTGRSGAFVVDLDVTADATGEAVWNAANLPLGTVVVRTPGGGYHHYFRQPPGPSLTVHKRIHGHPIDVRADGGHVYAPGAVILGPGDVPELRGYELLTKLAPADRLAVLPESVATFLHAERGTAKRTPAAQGEVRERSAVIEILKSQTEKLAAMERRTESGFRAALLGAAMVWGRAVAAGIVTEEAAFKRLERACAAVWGQADRDDRRNIRHGLEDGQADPWTVVPDGWDTTVSTVADRDRSSSGAVSPSKINPGVSNDAAPGPSYNLSNGDTEEAVSVGVASDEDGAGNTGNTAGSGLPAELEEGPDSWAPVDLGPFLDGEVIPPAPTVGVVRDDGARVLYAGLEHAVIGAMEAGKSWFALACVAAELVAGRRVLYVHFEESSPRTTVERLILLGVAKEVIRSAFVFVGPERRITATDVDRLLAGGAPSLVILDGQNEAMALHGQEIMAPEGAAEYRRKLVKPFTRAGAAVLSLDHVVKDAEAAREGYALGSAHKGNGLDGALILLENVAPFGRGRDGASMVSVTKDRPAALRQLGQQRDPRNPRKFFVGVMHVEASSADWRFRFAAPGQPDAGEDPEFAAMREERAAATKEAELDEAVLAAVVALASNPNVESVSTRKVCGEVGGNWGQVLKALDRLEIAGRVKNQSVTRSASWVPVRMLPDSNS